MGGWTMRREYTIARAALGFIVALTFGAASLAVPTTASAGVSVSIGVPGFWGYYGPPPAWGPYYYGYPYGYAYYGYPGPRYWHRPWRHGHGHWRHWR
jgi:hypothetical protein